MSSARPYQQRAATSRFVGLFLLFAVCAPAQPASPGLTFKGVQMRQLRASPAIGMATRDVELDFDDAGRALRIKLGGAAISAGTYIVVPYDDVVKVVAEKTAHWRGTSVVSGLATVSTFVTGIFGSIAATAIANQQVSFGELYLECKPGVLPERFLLAIGKSDAIRAVSKAQEAFGNRMTEYGFPEAEKIDKSQLPGEKRHYSLKTEKKPQPLPGLRPDKAFVLVVCPLINVSPLYHGGRGGPYQVFANDNVITVNRDGTYSYAFLDPGEYLFASRTANRKKIAGLRVKLEAGKDYYFLQDMLGGWMGMDTGLSLHSRDLVMFERDGAYYNDWSVK